MFFKVSRFFFSAQSFASATFPWRRSCFQLSERSESRSIESDCAVYAANRFLFAGVRQKVAFPNSRFNLVYLLANKTLYSCRTGVYERRRGCR